MKELSLQELAVLVNSGNTDAIIELGNRYECGIGVVKKDINSAIELYTVAFRA